jgi:hypothetical protein
MNFYPVGAGKVVYFLCVVRVLRDSAGIIRRARFH